MDAKEKHKKANETGRFRLSFINEATTTELWTIKMSRTKVIASILIVLLAISCILTTIIVFTPIRTLLPGYLKISQRQENIINSMRIDSLTTAVNINNAYISTITDILTDNIDTTATTASQHNDSVAQIIPIDSIIDASNAEQQFVKQFEEQERFNLSVLAPIAAEGMMFYTPVYGATVIENEQPTSTLTLTAPALAPISSIYNGTVIECYYTPASGNVIIIQHHNDFISKYTGIGETFITKGDKVITGQRIGLAARTSQSATYPLTFELWHNGSALSPMEYIAF